MHARRTFSAEPWRSERKDAGGGERASQFEQEEEGVSLGFGSLLLVTVRWCVGEYRRTYKLHRRRQSH